MIKIENLSKKYDKKYALENLNCSISENCIYGLVGVNGAGKSTLLRIINGIYASDGGIVTIDGDIINDTEKFKQKLVFVPDDLFFYSGYTLKEHAKYYEAMYEKFDMKYFIELAGLLKLDLNAKISTFSKGMKRQTSLICALATTAEYMFFDETFDGLDPVVRNLVKKLISKQMKKQRTTVILTSHNLREL